MENNAARETVYFPTLDVLRAFAVLGVMLAHGFNAMVGLFGYPLSLADPGDVLVPNATGKQLHVFTENLNIGVEMFFILSGFLITFLLLKEKTKLGRIDLPKFYLRRALRIWPLYFLVVALAPWWVSFTDSPSHPDYLSTATFMNNFHTMLTGRWDYPFAHFWSVCIEEHFYLVWPVLLLLLPVKRLPLLFFGLIAGSILFRYACMYTLDNPYPWWVLHTVSRMDELVIGGMIAWRHFHQPIRFRPHWLLRVLVYLSFFVLLGLWDRSTLEGWAAVGFKKYIYFAFLVFIFADFTFNERMIAFFSKRGILHYLGKISYGMYIFHNVLFYFITYTLMPFFGFWSKWSFFALFMLLTILLATVSYYLFEKRFLKLKDRFALVATRKPEK